MKYPSFRVQEALLKKKLISKEDIYKAIEVQNKENIALEDAIVKLEYLTYQEIIQCLAEQYDLSVIDLEATSISNELIDLLPTQIIKKNGIIPIEQNNGHITIAASAPLDLSFIDNLRFMLNSDVKCVLAQPDIIRNTIRKYFDQESTETVGSLLKEIGADISSEEGPDSEYGEASAKEADIIEDDSPIIQLVSLIINKAIVARASDIHVEPLPNRLRVRYRVDGVCQESDVLPKNLQDAIISRLKILANIDISEKRRPQDGRISIKHSGNDLDIRVSCLPSIYGESVVMRILEKSSVLMKLENLGFYENDKIRYNAIIKKPNGIMLITGPTGSGKTTTLYATINELNSPEQKIITAEDPVEYTLCGVNQSEVNDKIGLSFASILRTMLRQDPNIVLVGEIRDAETAETAITAALTGHFVFSTLHTNDAPSAITRLIDMEIKSFLVSSSLQGIMAQRLIRTICPHCKEMVKYTPEQLVAMGFDVNTIDDFNFYKGKGCKKCSNVGYKGRLGIYELLEMNETLRDLTYNVATTDEIRQAAIKTGMTTLKEDGLRKAKDGKTTLEEVLRVAGID